MPRKKSETETAALPELQNSELEQPIHVSAGITEADECENEDQGPPDPNIPATEQDAAKPVLPEPVSAPEAPEEDASGSVSSETAEPVIPAEEMTPAYSEDGVLPGSFSNMPESVIPDGAFRGAEPSEKGAIQAEDRSPEPVIQTEATQPAIRRPRRRAVVSLDGQRSELTASARRRQDLIDLSESMKSGRVLTGIIAGVERAPDNPNNAYAVIYHGAFKVIIPQNEITDFQEDAAENYRSATLSRRLGAEVDFVVKGIETDADIAAASRTAAMAQRRREFYLATNRDGSHVLEEGDIAEARVVSVIRTGVFVELFGIEQFIPLSELSYMRWVDATVHMRVGQKVLVKVLSLDRSDRRNIRVALSVKQAGEDTFRQAISRFKVGNIYVGTVSMITAVGVFVSFESVSCLCQFPKRRRPAIGSPVTVRILGADLDEMRLWGVIVYS